MKPVELLRRSLDALAGQQYPDAQNIRATMSRDGVVEPIIQRQIDFETREWRTDLIHLRGLTKLVQTRGES